MADINANRWTNFLIGSIGLLLSTVGYFLVSRDTEFKETNSKFWQQLSGLKQDITDLKIKHEQRTELLQWIVEAAKDKEQRIRDLERECGKNRK